MSSFGSEYIRDAAMKARLEKEDQEDRLLYREMLSAEVEEFYNMDHNPETGRFDVGEDGPGRKKDNIAKAEKTLGKNAPTWMKNILSRRVGRALEKSEKLLPAKAAQYQKDIIKRRAESNVLRGE